VKIFLITCLFSVNIVTILHATKIIAISVQSGFCLLNSGVFLSLLNTGRDHLPCLLVAWIGTRAVQMACLQPSRFTLAIERQSNLSKSLLPCEKNHIVITRSLSRNNGIIYFCTVVMSLHCSHWNFNYLPYQVYCSWACTAFVTPHMPPNSAFNKNSFVYFEP